jgi:hypothetical protein
MRECHPSFQIGGFAINVARDATDIAKGMT